MDYYGLLFLYYLKGLSGKSILRLFFNIEAGGTEQLLPENTSTPTTTPILADIQYPDELRTDQYFTYRETPTTVSNKARIKTIKGNTLVWNQLVGTNVNGLSTIQGTTFSLNSNGSIHVTGTGTGNHFCEWRTNENPSFVMVKGHKYLATFKGLTNGIIAQVGVYTTATTYLINKTNLVGSYAEIVTPTQDGITGSLIRFYATNTFSGTTDITMQLFDLTQMGLDITDPSEFTSLFPLPYYDYNQGTLLSFMGNGIKTVGKNQFNKETVTHGRFINYNDYSAASELLAHSDYIRVLPNTLYCSNTPRSAGVYKIVFYDSNKTLISFGNANLTQWTTPSNCAYVRINLTEETVDSVYFNIGTDMTYEPYASSTLSLPISTYFPNGMDGVGTDYDELTESKAYHRMTRVDLGSLEWTYLNDGIFRTSAFPNVKKDYIPKWLTTADYQVASATNYAGWKTRNMQMGFLEGYQFIIFMNTSFTDATAFKESLNGVYLVYPLATPTETPIATEDANEALSLLMGRSVSSSNAKQMIDIITKGE